MFAARSRNILSLNLSGGIHVDRKSLRSRIASAISFFTGVSLAQNVTSSVVGRIVDPANAVLASAPVTLTDQNTGNTRSANADSAGLFRFADIAPGTYSLAIQASGFKTLNEKDIVVSASETRDLGTLHLELGNVTDSISVTAEAQEIQLSSSEKSQSITGDQLSMSPCAGEICSVT